MAAPARTAAWRQRPLLLRPRCILRLVNADATLLAGLHAEIVADADDQLVTAIAVQVREPDRMAPLELIIDDVASP